VRLLPEAAEPLRNHPHFTDLLYSSFDCALLPYLWCQQFSNMATAKAPTKGEEQRYDDNDEGLHPDDVLIAKWFPECTTLEDLDNEVHRPIMLRTARQAEADLASGVGSVPPQVPWPKPPRRLRSQLEPAVKEWRQPRLHMIKRAVYQIKRTTSRVLTSSYRKKEFVLGSCWNLWMSAYRELSRIGVRACSGARRPSSIGHGPVIHGMKSGIGCGK
jgi:hypothetical protein